VSLILRTLRKNKFVRELQPAWVPQADVQSDALKDLETLDNELSVWLVEDDLSNLARILAALAANRDQLANIDFALLDLEVITTLGLLLQPTVGLTPDRTVSLLHRDLAQVTATQLTQLAQAITTHARLERRSKSQVRAFLLDSIAAGYIEFESLKEGIATKLT